ncbi:MAG: GGDEF domain-containing protein, partial [Eubacteriales bacterium]|nr:GGDEF domain-containing protein [Eubacteriales bacterium]
MISSFRLAALLAFQAPLLCLIICAYIFFSLSKNGITRRQYQILRDLSVTCVISMLCELFVGLISYDILPWDIRALSSVTNTAYFFTLLKTILLTEFFLSVTERLSRKFLTAIRVLYLVVALILLARVFLSGTKLFQYFDEEENILYGPLDDLQTWGCFVIDVLISGMLLGKCLDKKEFVEQEKNRKMLIASLIPTVTVLIYLLFYIPYLIWMGSLLVLLYLYTGLQGLMIYQDELTSLSNRRRMLKDIQIKNRDNVIWSYILADIDSFKQVNDTYGHNEGDRAIISVATALKETALKFGASAYRLGGDEFAVILSTDDETAIRRFCEE